jgi:hypothetical protein
MLPRPLGALSAAGVPAERYWHPWRVIDRLQRLARHLPAFEEPGFSFGSWVPSQEREDGVIVMGWYEPGPEAQAFLADLGGWITTSDWPRQLGRCAVSTMVVKRPADCRCPCPSRSSPRPV